MSKISLFGPSITRKEVDYVTDAVENAWLENANLYHQRFEEAFRKSVNRKFSLSVSCCTHAIHLALLSLGVGRGDEVIVPECTWIASVAPIVQIGAIPVFTDIDPNYWCLTVDSIEHAISARTKAILVVDLYGNMADYEGILALARKYNLRVIEDSAESIGSSYRGRPAGSFGDISVFSFHGTKMVTTGEGGMLVTDDIALYEKSCMLSDHGRPINGDRTINQEIAYKYKMSSMQAALGLAQLERIDDILFHKKQIFSFYQKYLGERDDLRLNTPIQCSSSNYWLITVTWSKKLNCKVEDVIRKLKVRGVESRPFFVPLSRQPAFVATSADYRVVESKYALDISSRSINLPSSLHLKKKDIGFVCEVFLEILSET